MGNALAHAPPSARTPVSPRLPSAMSEALRAVAVSKIRLGRAA
jgi:hypothetical protein